MRFKKTPFYYQNISPKVIASFIKLYPEFAKFIDPKKPLPVRYYGDFFTALFHIITSQQVSSKVVDSIWSYFNKNFGRPTAKKIMDLKIDLLRSCGINDQKIRALKAVATLVINKDIKTKRFNEKLVEKLNYIKGIGPWTIKTLALFYYQRNDIFIHEDLAIKSAYRKLYHQELENQINQLEVELQKNKMASLFTILSYVVNASKIKSPVD